MSKANQTMKKLTGSIAVVVILAVGLCLTTFALLYTTVAVEENLFQTGTVKINLNDGQPVITENEFLFEPGMTVEKEFFLENESTVDVYYRLYLDNLEGGLADVLDVAIRQGDTVLFSGKASELTRETVGAADDLLKLGERRDLVIAFHFPEESVNDASNLYLSFNLNADAVQVKNNPDRLFD